MGEKAYDDWFFNKKKAEEEPPPSSTMTFDLSSYVHNAFWGLVAVAIVLVVMNIFRGVVPTIVGWFTGHSAGGEDGKEYGGQVRGQGHDGQVVFTPVYPKGVGIPRGASVAFSYPSNADVSIAFRPPRDGSAYFDVVDRDNRRMISYQAQFSPQTFITSVSQDFPDPPPPPPFICRTKPRGCIYPPPPSRPWSDDGSDDGGDDNGYGPPPPPRPPPNDSGFYRPSPHGQGQCQRREHSSPHEYYNARLESRFGPARFSNRQPQIQPPPPPPPQPPPPSQSWKYLGAYLPGCGSGNGPPATFLKSRDGTGTGSSGCGRGLGLGLGLWKTSARELYRAPGPCFNFGSQTPTTFPSSFGELLERQALQRVQQVQQRENEMVRKFGVLQIQRQPGGQNGSGNGGQNGNGSQPQPRRRHNVYGTDL